MESERLLLAGLIEAYPGEAARLIERLPSGQSAALFAEMPASKAAAVLGGMNSASSAECLLLMAAETAAEILAEAPVELVVAWLRQMEPAVQGRLLEALPAAVAGTARLLLRYPEGTAGAVMDPLVQAAAEDITVEEAQETMRRFPKNVYYYLYVVDRDRRLTGVLDIRELMLAPPVATVGSIMHRDVARLPVHASLSAIASHPRWRDFDALPVVDEAGAFVGVIRHRFVRSLAAGAPAGDLPQRGLATLLGLGEAYWIGLCELLIGVTSAVTPERNLKPLEELPDGDSN